MPSQIFLVRPGQTDFDAQHRVLGGLDLPMNQVGCQEVAELASQLTGCELDLILSGPVNPSFETAEILSERLDLPHKVCDGFRNLGQGLWEGLELEEVKRKFPSVYRHWEESPQEVSIPNAEPIEQAIKRVEKAIKKYTRKVPQVLIVAADPIASLIEALVEKRKLTLHSCHRHLRCKIEPLAVTTGSGIQ